MYRVNMTPQQKVSLQKTPSRDIETLMQEGGKKMRATVQRRRSSSSVITRALSKSKLNSRDITLLPAHSANGLLLGAFCSPNSTIILKERVQLTCGWKTQERLLYMFSDTLIISKSKSSSTVKLKKQIRLSDMWVSSSLGDISEKKIGSDNSFVIGWPTTNYIVTFSSSETKEKWLSTLCCLINEVKKDEHHTKFPINVLYLDGDEFISSTVVNASNMDSADTVIKMATQQLGISVRPADCHLWVVSGKDDSPYPLIGHEYPYCITMSYLREILQQSRGSNNNILDFGSEAVFLENLPREKQCHFILKVGPQTPLHRGRDSAQKHSKRKKSLIDWALRRSGSTNLHSPFSQSPTTPRKLFGMSLSSVCQNGHLPKPIMDMLLMLYEEGPNTKGIFRRSANAKTCKELKEKLISGDEVQIDGESVFVAAAVITDFLRNIPDSILSSDMYGLWMEATDMGQHEYKIKMLKRLLDQLPEANFVLLQYLFAVLHHIEKNSEENQMTAFNLALCIAPNMLWLPTASDPEEESRSARKVALLVQFLIENYELIFGQDTASLFKKPDQEHSASSEDLAGVSPIHGQDSSDELEFVASDLDKSDPNLLKGNGGMLDESLLLEEKEDWDLFSEITACYQSKARLNNLECYSKDSFSCIDSACTLSPSRDRCSSEPSVCLSSRIPVQEHEPVARQSSCDATIMHSRLDYINQLRQLQLESRKLLGRALSPNVNQSRQPNHRSSPFNTEKAKNNPQKSNLSSRSSFSSLSSTTTSPSASSLSSLDSAFSYCSESSVFSPNEATSQPFMFGTSARLHTLSPEISKKKLKEWHLPLSTLLGGDSFDLDSNEEQAEPTQKTSAKNKGAESRLAKNMPDKIPDSTNVEDFDCHGQDTNCVNITHEQKCETSFTKIKVAPENGKSVQRETSRKHIELKKPDNSFDEGKKQTKITFFVSPNMQVKNFDEQNSQIDSNDLISQNMKLHIPQTIFYGQDTPLVLHSVSRKQHSGTEKPHWQTQLKHVLRRSPTKETLSGGSGEPREGPTDIQKDMENVIKSKLGSQLEGTVKESVLHKSPSKAIASFSHSIRIILPSSVRNTVKEYFKHNESIPPTSPMETVDDKLIQNSMERCSLQGPNIDRLPKGQSHVVEESFV